MEQEYCKEFIKRNCLQISLYTGEGRELFSGQRDEILVTPCSKKDCDNYSEDHETGKGFCKTNGLVFITEQQSPLLTLSYTAQSLQLS